MLRYIILLVPAIFLIVLAEEYERERRGYRCAMFLGHHCFGEPYDPQCGSNNMTYYNRCDFAKNHCQVRTIHLAHNGTCHGESQEGTLTHGEWIVLQYTCELLLLKGCPDDIAEICASNGKTYLNECEYELQRCMHPELTILKREACVA
ncbi:agrin-like [Mytilus californianus]|uniref:agrin-like n=1 Tax=Mytilus californianus TaxID=6549 RepID=UPI00224845BD|nr:agrin-like [Mytilus californianus]